MANQYRVKVHYKLNGRSQEWQGVIKANDSAEAREKALDGPQSYAGGNGTITDCKVVEVKQM